MACCELQITTYLPWMRSTIFSISISAMEQPGRSHWPWKLNSWISLPRRFEITGSAWGVAIMAAKEHNGQHSAVQEEKIRS